LLLAFRRAILGGSNAGRREKILAGVKIPSGDARGRKFSVTYGGPIQKIGLHNKGRALGEGGSKQIIRTASAVTKRGRLNQKWCFPQRKIKVGNLSKLRHIREIKVDWRRDLLHPLGGEDSFERTLSEENGHEGERFFEIIAGSASSRE